MAVMSSRPKSRLSSDRVKLSWAVCPLSKVTLSLPSTMLGGALSGAANAVALDVAVLDVVVVLMGVMVSWAFATLELVCKASGIRLRASERVDPPGNSLSAPLKDVGLDSVGHCA